MKGYLTLSDLAYDRQVQLRAFVGPAGTVSLQLFSENSAALLPVGEPCECEVPSGT